MLEAWSWPRLVEYMRSNGAKKNQVNDNRVSYLTFISLASFSLAVIQPVDYTAKQVQTS